MKIDRAYKEQKNLNKVVERQNKITKTLNEATKAYDEGEPIMSDKEWDNLFFELTEMETVEGVQTINSPTQIISYEVVNELEKIKHEHPMLSLPKTKSVDELKAFVGDHDFILMSKLDGLTCSLTYENGELIRAETRGDGLIGENILHNAKIIKNIPQHIDYLDRLVVDGEIICKYNDFEEFSNEYKNPRNFAAGSIRLLDSEECAKRNLSFIVWDVIEGFGPDFLHERLDLAETYGFETVYYYLPKEKKDLYRGLDNTEEISNEFNLPIDGVVIKYESKKLRDSLPFTGHHLGGAIAFKFYNEEYPTNLLDIEWTMGRTGILTPVAVFEPIEIDGSIVERASLHNLTIMKEILGTETPTVGDIVYVYKSNEIIPQISRMEFHPIATEVIELPTKCPLCGESVVRQESDSSDTVNLVCPNPNCPGKLINRIDHYCGKKGLDIKGLSKKTLEKLIDWGWINKLSDIYFLNEHRKDWITKSGFGPTSVDKILNSIKENSENISLESYISSLGIPLIGRSVSKELVKHIDSWADFRKKIDDKFDFSTYDNIGENKLNFIYNFNYDEADSIVEKGFVKFAAPVKEELQNQTIQTLENQNIVITGSLELYKNRAELTDVIIKHGGKVSNSVSKNTTILINNNIASTSSKNQRAKELKIPILTEKDFSQKYLT